MPQSLAVRSEQLLQLSLDEHGLLQDDRISAVVQGIQQSAFPAKISLLRSYARKVARFESTTKAIVTSAHQLSQHAQHLVEAKVLELHPEVRTFAWQESKDLLGGITIQVGDTWYDQSVQHRLMTIREHLSQ